MNSKPIYVTQPSLAPLDELTELLKGVWERGILTHNGPLVQRLEKDICSKVDLKNFITVINGTIAIQMAIKALELKGEIITTPFTWVATLSAIQWEGCTPVFCDIEADTLNIDPLKIEEKITDKTVAIMPVHVFGNPCDVEAIEAIAKKHGLKVIYDAAHCFGVNYNGQSIFNFGDVSTCSFHATKLFHTGEGGAIFCQDQSTLHEMKYRNSFGHNGQEEYFGLGINAKMSELQAAMGLSVLPYIDQIIANRKRVCDYYTQNLNFTNLSRLKLRANTKWNYSYYPVIFSSELLKADSFLILSQEFNPFKLLMLVLSNSTEIKEFGKLGNSPFTGILFAFKVSKLENVSSPLGNLFESDNINSFNAYSVLSTECR